MAGWSSSSSSSSFNGPRCAGSVPDNGDTAHTLWSYCGLRECVVEREREEREREKRERRSKEREERGEEREGG
eukprot:3941567-Rhodomonas_salina.4